MINTSHGFLPRTIPITPICGPLGTHEAEEQTFLQLSPNPGSDLLSINTGLVIQEKRNVVIYGIAGNEVYNAYIYEAEFKINVQGFAKGLYVIQILGTSISTGKFIID